MLSDLEMEDWREHRKDLLTGRLDAIKSYDQAMLTISSAALAITLTVVQQILVAPGTAVSTTQGMWFGIAWAGFGCSIFLTTFSFLISHAAYNNEIAHVDRILTSRREVPRRKRWLGIATTWFNWGSAIGFVVGIVALARLLYLTL